ncbi:hypothetical protein PTSG_11679 [Salpingoeca rosetta]|uniref:WD repeat-containing protein 54 beta-propeller domain-containing protein n=1 Tax=Salpingoeca rosetta (strain ATCC 50818 / BSB-021) TaxID=946362 RepID=F2TY92_SALR5|nr:uncharacterized protein PTSG_11679 [Salpingoeca rosetta]EGD76351.1 hypothetical protein PTSG_11679 [Salpingoeca rosetta]|eukprot:XP_004998526.1 hypothetical protein PTSG_11679 [Salpingoeca rosetta]
MVFSPKAKQVSLAASAALLPNNLSALHTRDYTAFYYIHNAAVWQTVLVGDKEEHKLMCMLDELAAVQQAVVVSCAGTALDEDVLVVAGLGCIRFQTLTGQELAVFQPDASDSGADDPMWFRGIAHTAREILVGTSEGQVLVFDMKTFQLDRQQDAAKSPITTIAATNNLVAVAEESGCISLWGPDMSFHRHLIGDPTDIPCNSMRIASSRLYCGMEDGTLRIFCFDTFTLLATVHAHGRGVTAVDVSPDGHFVTSTGLDCKAQVWRIGLPKTADTPIRVDLAFTATIKDRMLVGVAFLGDKKLAVSCFDSYKLVVFTKL